MTTAKKAIPIVLIVLGLGALIGALPYSLPKSISLRLEGLEYRLGDANNFDEVKPIVLVIDHRAVVR